MTAAPDDAGSPAWSDDAVELFVGQVLALFPLRIRPGTNAVGPLPALRSVFPRSLDARSPSDSGDDQPPSRARTYSAFIDGPGHGFLTVGDYRIEVVILRLDVATPPDATVFRIAAMTGRTIQLTGVVVEPPLSASG